VVADLPGLIEGAHHGAGLGDEFLRHVERTSFLVHVIDLVPPDESDPVENFKLIENELKQYSETLYKRPRMIVANKMDVTGAEESVERLRKALKRDVIQISAATGVGVKEFVNRLVNEVSAYKAELKAKAPTAQAAAKP
jgi:GTPase